MDNVGLKLEVTDDQVTAVVENLANKAVNAQESIEGIGTQSDQTTRKVSQGFKAQETAIIQTTRTADEYKRSIEQNKQQIERLNKSLNSERLLLLKLEKQYSKFGNTASKEAQTLKKQIDLLNESVKKSSTETKRLSEENNKTSGALKNLASSARQSEDQLKSTNKESKGLKQTFSDLFNRIKGGLFEPLLQKLPQVSTVTGGASRAMRIFSGTLKSTSRSVLLLAGTFAIIAAVILAVIALPLVLFFSGSQKGAEYLSDKLAYLSGVIGELINRFVRLGEVIFDYISGTKEWADVTDAAATAVNGLKQALDEAGQAAQSYRIIQNRLKKEQDEFIVTEGRVLAAIDERRRATDDETKSFATRRASLRETMKLEADLEKQRLKFAADKLQSVRNDNSNADGDITNLEAVNKAERELIDLRRTAATRAAQDEQTLKQLNNEAVQAYRQRQEALRDLQKQSEGVLRQLQDMQNADADGIEKIRIDTVKAIEEVGRLEASLRELYKERGIEFDLAGDFEATIQAIEQRGAEAVRDFERKKNLAEAKAREAGLDAARQADLKRIEQREELALALVDVDRKQGLTEIEAEQARARQRLQIQIEYTRQRLALLEDQNSIEAALFRANIESLQQDIEGLSSVNLTAVERLGERIRSALGLTSEEFSAVGDLFAQFGSTLMETINSVTEAQIQEQDRLIDAIGERVQATASALAEQQKLQEQGFANDAQLLEQKLAADQATLEKAEAKKLALQKKQAAAQLRIDAAQQSSAYLTTVFNLLASESKRGIIGLIAVAAGGLALIGSIVAKAKANAKQFEPPKFRDGTEFVHGPGTGTSDSVLAYLSRGERVVDFQKNRELEGVSNSELVHYFKIGKTAANAPSFNNVDEKTAAAVRHGKAVSALEKEKDATMLAAAYASAASKMSGEMINYWKTRPVTYVTPDGTVIEYEKGGVKVRQNIKNG